MKKITMALNITVYWINRIIKDIGCVVLCTIIFSITAGIVSRYVFNSPFTWTEELTTFMMVYLCYISAACTTVEKKHIVADFFITKAPEKFRRFTSVLSRLLMVVFFVVICISIVSILPNLVWLSPVLRIHRKFYYYPILVLSAFMCFSVLVDLLNEIVPGCDYIGMKNAEEAQKALEREREETEAMQSNMNEFMADAGYRNADTNKGGVTK